MAGYSASGTQTVMAAPGVTALGIAGSTLTRAKLFFWLVAAIGTPADNAILWYLRRFSAAGTSTPVTPTPLDLADGLAQIAAGENHTVEPTFTTALFSPVAVHQRSLYQWNAHPSREILIPAVAGAGVALTPAHAAYAGDASAVMHWEE